MDNFWLLISVLHKVNSIWVHKASITVIAITLCLVIKVQKCLLQVGTRFGHDATANTLEFMGQDNFTISGKFWVGKSWTAYK